MGISYHIVFYYLCGINRWDYIKFSISKFNYQTSKKGKSMILQNNVKLEAELFLVTSTDRVVWVFEFRHSAWTGTLTDFSSVVETRTNIIIVMEYAVNGELFDYINERRYLDEAESRKYFRQIVSAVDYCHKVRPASMVLFVL